MKRIRIDVREIGAELRERVAPVEVVRIDDGERLLDDVARRADRMRRTPRLRAPLREGVRRRQVVEILVAVVDGNKSLVLLADFLLELRLEVLADDEDNLPEPAADRVEHRVVENRLAGRPHRIDLLQPTVTRAHARRQYHQSWFHFSFLH